MSERSRNPYWIWKITPRDSDVILMAGLGYRKHASRRWKELTSRRIDIPIRLYQLLSKLDLHPACIKISVYGKYERRVDAREILLNLRMQHPFATIEDWLS